jgi:uncharacterized protein
MTSPDQADTVDPKLTEILVCPRTHHVLTLHPSGKELISRKERLAFPIRDGIPIMRIDEARQLTDEEFRALFGA